MLEIVFGRRIGNKPMKIIEMAKGWVYGNSQKCGQKLDQPKCHGRGFNTNVMKNSSFTKYT